jgi:hypothetical protein
MSMKKKDDSDKKVFVEQMKSRVEKLILRGVTSREDLARAVGAGLNTIDNWKEEIFERWKRDDIQDRNVLRIRRVLQLEKIANVAIDEFERSRKDSEETVQTTAVCSTCGGKKVEESKAVPGRMVKCSKCRGTGMVLVSVVVKVKGKEGDPSYLRVAKDCITECAELEGLFPSQTKMTARSLVTATSMEDQTMRTHLTEFIYEGDEDVIVRAKAVLADLKKKIRTKDVTFETRAIPQGEDTLEGPNAREYDE